MIPAGFELVTESSALQDLVARLVAHDRYALDTEFHRERTFWPRLALVQLAWAARGGEAAGVALVDPLAVDVVALAPLLRSSAVMIAHACDQDLEVLLRACGEIPCALWDTQVAAGFTGSASSSLASLSKRYLGIEVVKGDRLTDWNRRPLTSAQLTYAAADVEHLLELADAVAADLASRGRRAWADEECELVRRRPYGPGDPEVAWWKLRDARQLRGPARGVAQEVSAWRERRARLVDVPVRQVLPDLALQAIAHNPPADRATLRRVRGLEGRHLRDDVETEVLAAVAAGRRLDPAMLRVPASDDIARELRPAIALAAAWVAQLAKDEEIDAALLATRHDLTAYLRREPDARLAEGWRAELVGGPLRELVGGRAALAFDGRGGLVLEARSGQAITALAPGPSTTA